MYGILQDGQEQRRNSEEMNYSLKSVHTAEVAEMEKIAGHFQSI